MNEWLYKRLRSILDEPKTLFSYQFLFRKSHSTCMTLMILMDDLKNFLALIWFPIYLANRFQFVTYNGVSFETTEVKCGVPQGSILEPLFLSI